MTAKIRFNCNNGCWIEVDASNPKDAVKQMSSYLEVFQEQACGQCGGTVLAWEHRQDKEDHDYYSIRCRQCGAELRFGQTRKGERLFAKRKLDSGEYDKDHHGWTKWRDKQNPEF